MRCLLTIVRYPKWFGWAGFLSMALFRFPLWFSRDIRFWKLLGCGKNGTFDKKPDWRQWGVLAVWSNSSNTTPDSKLQTPDFFLSWWKFFRCEIWTIALEPIEGHGMWDRKKCFGELPVQNDYEGMIGILTRATIRMNKLRRFWKHVNDVADRTATAEGFITSFGIGEIPWIKQATFSVWESREHMKQFAYRSKEHTEVIRKTREENWYSEQMFVRFRVLHTQGSLHGKDPLNRNS